MTQDANGTGTLREIVVVQIEFEGKSNDLLVCTRIHGSSLQVYRLLTRIKSGSRLEYSTRQERITPTRKGSKTVLPRKGLCRNQ